LVPEFCCCGCCVGLPKEGEPNVLVVVLVVGFEDPNKPPLVEVEPNPPVVVEDPNAFVVVPGVVVLPKADVDPKPVDEVTPPPPPNNPPPVLEEDGFDPNADVGLFDVPNAPPVPNPPDVVLVLDDPNNPPPPTPVDGLEGVEEPNNPPPPPTPTPVFKVEPNNPPPPPPKALVDVDPNADGVWFVVFNDDDPNPPPNADGVVAVEFVFALVA
jgi:hypothetical protein